MGFGDGIRDAIKGKSKEISGALSERYREHVGIELTQREEKLQQREAAFQQRVRQLDEREKGLAQREAQLSRHFHVRKTYVLGVLLLALAAAGTLAYLHWKTGALVTAWTKDDGRLHASLPGGPADRQDRLARAAYLELASDRMLTP